MEKLAHYLELRTLQYPSENEEDIKKAVNTVLKLESGELVEKIKTQEMESQEGAKIKKHSYKTERWSEVKQIIKTIFREIEKPEKIYDHLDTEEGEFYIRLDKQKLHQGKFELSKGGDVVHIKIKIASYPFRKEKIKKNLKKLINTE